MRVHLVSSSQSQGEEVESCISFYCTRDKLSAASFHGANVVPKLTAVLDGVTRGKEREGKSMGGGKGAISSGSQSSPNLQTLLTTHETHAPLLPSLPPVGNIQDTVGGGGGVESGGVREGRRGGHFKVREGRRGGHFKVLDLQPESVPPLWSSNCKHVIANTWPFPVPSFPCTAKSAFTYWPDACIHLLFCDGDQGHKTCSSIKKDSSWVWAGLAKIAWIIIVHFLRISSESRWYGQKCQFKKNKLQTHNFHKIHSRPDITSVVDRALNIKNLPIHHTKILSKYFPWWLVCLSFITTSTVTVMSVKTNKVSATADSKCFTFPGSRT